MGNGRIRREGDAPDDLADIAVTRGACRTSPACPGDVVHELHAVLEDGVRGIALVAGPAPQDCGREHAGWAD